PGGFSLLAKTVTQLTGIHFTGGGIVNFGGFQAVVKALDGIDMYVDEEVTSIHIGTDRNGAFAQPFYINDDGTVGGARAGVTPQVYHVGPHHFTDWEALDYCRQRDLLGKGDG